ncbi:MAG: pre-peptidase C-terminal domain-containing protein [bacterium]
MAIYDNVGCACCGAASGKENHLIHSEGPYGTKLQMVFSSTSQTSDENFSRAAVDPAFPGPVDSIPGDDTTTAILEVDIPVVAELNTVGDWDWFRFNVAADNSFTFSLSGTGTSPVNDTILRIYDDTSTLIAVNDDGGPGLFSELTIAMTAGDYFVEAASFNDSHAGEYTLEASLVDLGPDLIPDDLTTTEMLTVGTTVEEALNDVGDRDWFQFDVTSAGLYTFDLGPGASPAVPDTVLRLYDAAGNLVAENDDAGFFNLYSSLDMVIAEAGTYYVEAASFADAFSGNYTLDASFTDTGLDDLPTSFATPGVVTLGDTFTSQLDYVGDRDWVRIDVADTTVVQINLDGSGGTPLSDPTMRLYDSAGNLVAFNDDGGPGLNSEILSVLDAGSYYISAGSFADGGTGEYTISTAEFDLSSFDPLDAIDWGGTMVNVGAGNEIEVYFAAAGEVFDGVTSDGWNAYEMGQAMAALEVYEQYVDVNYVVTTDANTADFRLVTSSSIGALGYMYPPDPAFAGLEGIGVFNNGPGTGWSGAAGGGLDQGGFGFVTLIHEFGHGMGMAHPHDNGGGSDVMLGVQSAFGSLGFFDLNQGVYTTMSYNDSWQTSPFGQPAGFEYGYQGTIMALDIALMQDRYGANTNTNAGNTEFVLSDTNQVGTFYQTIWDTGGEDIIRHNGSESAVIDLRDASLSYEFGGGGFVSYVDGIFGGYTIANGAIIENASGGSGDDHLTGNEEINRLKGGDGDDMIFGMGGHDRITGGAGADAIDGGDGSDTVFYRFSDEAVTVSLLTGTGQGGTAEGDTFTSVERVSGSLYDDRLIGNAEQNAFFGGYGNDTLLGGAGKDLLTGDQGNDVLDGGEDRDNAYYSRSDAGVTIDLAAGLGFGGHAEGDILIDIENIIGSAHNDEIWGGDGFNNLYGHLSDDILGGGVGYDFLNGGAGADTFVIQEGWEKERVRDFEDGVDKFDVSDFGISAADAVSMAAVFGSGVALDFGAGDILIIDNAALADITTDDFIV